MTRFCKKFNKTCNSLAVASRCWWVLEQCQCCSRPSGAVAPSLWLFPANEAMTRSKRCPLHNPCTILKPSGPLISNYLDFVRPIPLSRRIDSDEEVSTASFSDSLGSCRLLHIVIHCIRLQLRVCLFKVPALTCSPPLPIKSPGGKGNHRR